MSALGLELPRNLCNRPIWILIHFVYLPITQQYNN